MSGKTFFVRPCPSCGRTTQIRIEFLGLNVCCQHCLRQFPANDPESESAALNDPIQYWAEYTEHTPTEEPFSRIDEAAPQAYPRNDWPTIRNPR